MQASTSIRMATRFDGKNLVFTTRNGISVLDLATREARQIVQGRVRLVEAGRKTARLYFIREGALASPMRRRVIPDGSRPYPLEVQSRQSTQMRRSPPARLLKRTVRIIAAIRPRKPVLSTSRSTRDR